MKNINENKQETIDSISMRKEFLLSELKRLKFPGVYKFVCSECWAVTRIQKRTLLQKHCQYLLTLRNLNNGGNEYVHHNVIQNACREFYKASISDYAILKNMGLMYEKIGLEGYYRVSQKGLDFLQDKIKINRAYYQIPNSQEFIFSTKMIGIFDVLKDLHYNYVEKDIKELVKL